MKAFETTATVDAQGSVRLSGVPFEPGTRVDVTITPALASIQAGSDPAPRAARLFAAMDAARNVDPVGALKRADLYDRDVIR